MGSILTGLCEQWREYLAISLAKYPKTTYLGIGSIWIGSCLIARMALIEYERKRDQLPPGPIGWPWIGSMIPLATNPKGFMNDQGNKWGPISHFTIGRQHMILINDSRLCHHILRLPSLQSRQRCSMLRFEDAGFGFVNGKNSKVRRRAMTSAISKLVRSTHIDRALNTVLDNVVIPSIEESIEFEKTWLCRRYMNHITFNALYHGCTGELILDLDSPFISKIIELNEIFFEEYSNVLFLEFLGLDYFGTTDKFVGATKEENELMLKLIRQCQENRNEMESDEKSHFTSQFESLIDSNRSVDFKDDDSLSLMSGVSISSFSAPTSDTFWIDSLLSRQRRETKERKGGPLRYFSDKFIANDIQNLFLAGTAFTSTELEGILVKACQYPDIQDRVANELKRVVMKNRKDDFEWNLLGKCNLFKAFIRESQRLLKVMDMTGYRNVSTQTDLIVNELNTVINDGLERTYKIPANSMVVVNVEFINCNSNNEGWIEPVNRMHLENHLDEKGNFELHPSFIKFLSGDRDCPGKSVAIKVIYTVIGKLLYRYSFSACPPLTKDSPLKFSEGLSNKLDPEIQLVIQPRE